MYAPWAGGGANVLFGDGSVRYVATRIQLNAWAAMSSMNLGTWSINQPFETPRSVAAFWFADVRFVAVGFVAGLPVGARPGAGGRLVARLSTSAGSQLRKALYLIKLLYTACNTADPTRLAASRRASEQADARRPAGAD